MSTFIGLTEAVALILQIVAAALTWYALVLVRSPNSNTLKVNISQKQAIGSVFVLLISILVWLRNVFVLRGEF